MKTQAFPLLIWQKCQLSLNNFCKLFRFIQCMCLPATNQFYFSVSFFLIRLCTNRYFTISITYLYVYDTKREMNNFCNFKNSLILWNKCCKNCNWLEFLLPARDFTPFFSHVWPYTTSLDEISNSIYSISTDRIFQPIFNPITSNEKHGIGLSAATI